ncbi:MAG TPA: carbonic anhydrase [Solirubrobacterales bacterium]|nr:carbonic anhydrase [Solirubrobacterales bacterium]
MPDSDQMLEFARSRAKELATPDLDARPRRRVAVLTCMDARIDIAQLLGISQGDAHVIRNAGGLATDDAIRSLSISQQMLGTKEIIVVMHEDCGLQGTTEEELAAILAADEPSPPWRTGAFEDLEKTLQASLAHLRNSAYLPARHSIRGFIFDPRDGSLREV